jgi:positive regulator of sigma E activity
LVDKVVEQICIIRAIEIDGSSSMLSLEPKKQQCPTCDGKCVKMLKPTELIKLKSNLKNLELNQELVLYMDKADLRGMVMLVLGLPLFVLLFIVVIGAYLKISEIYLIAIIAISLASMFYLQTKYLQFNRQIKVRKLDKFDILVEKDY